MVSDAFSDSESKDDERRESSGRQPSPFYSVLYGIISKRRCVLPRNYSLQENQVLRELALASMSLACLVAHMVEAENELP